jgi:hypothetical protein
MMIASRVLILRNADGTQVEILIRIYAPKQDDIDWSCRYEIDWPDGPRSHAAIGIDAVQALYLAMQMIGIELYTSGYHETGNLSWGEPGQGYGFPVTNSSRDLLVGDDAKYY